VKVLIREGLYSPEQIADLLLLSVWNPYASEPHEDFRRAPFRARKVLLNRPKRPKPRTSESMMYLAAYDYQQKARSKGKRCADQTALKKVWGGGGRSLWDKLNAQGQTLEQVVLAISENTGVKF
jgi:hypothetical protein